MAWFKFSPWGRIIEGTKDQPSTFEMGGARTKSMVCNCGPFALAPCDPCTFTSTSIFTFISKFY
jgi:hypothetical protein